MNDIEGFRSWFDKPVLFEPEALPPGQKPLWGGA